MSRPRDRFKIDQSSCYRFWVHVLILCRPPHRRGTTEASKDRFIDISSSLTKPQIKRRIGESSAAAVAAIAIYRLAVAGSKKDAVAYDYRVFAFRTWWF